MRLCGTARLIASVIVASLACTPAVGGPAMLVVDSSNSMWGALGSGDKRGMVHEALRRALEARGSGLEMGVITYGHRSKTSCRDIETLFPVGPVSPSRYAARIDRLKPLGRTPTSRALTEAARQLAAGSGRGTVLLVTDGEDNCGPDPCATAAGLARNGDGITVHVVALAVPPESHARLSCIAGNTAGTFAAAAGREDLIEAVEAAFRRIDAAQQEQAPVVARLPVAPPAAAERMSAPAMEAARLLGVATSGDIWPVAPGPPPSAANPEPPVPRPEPRPAEQLSSGGTDQSPAADTAASSAAASPSSDLAVHDTATTATGTQSPASPEIPAVTSGNPASPADALPAAASTPPDVAVPSAATAATARQPTEIPETPPAAATPVASDDGAAAPATGLPAATTSAPPPAAVSLAPTADRMPPPGDTVATSAGITPDENGPATEAGLPAASVPASPGSAPPEPLPVAGPPTASPAATGAGLPAIVPDDNAAGSNEDPPSPVAVAQPALEAMAGRTDVTGTIPETSASAPNVVTPHALGIGAVNLPDEVRPAYLVAEEVVASGSEALELRARITAATQPITRPIHWTVHQVTEGPEDAWQLAGESTAAEASFGLEPGQYVVRASYGAIRAAKVVIVRPRQRIDVTFILNGGALRVLPALAFLDVPEGIRARTWVFGAGDNGEHRLFAEASRPGEVLRLNAGTYHLVNRFGAANAVVEADITVKPGMLTEVEINHKVGIVHFAFARHDTDKPVGTVLWQIDNARGAAVLRAEGSRTTQILAPGSYSVTAEYNGRIYRTRFEIAMGETKDVELVGE